MKILQEITEWDDNTPNHVYHVNDAGKLVAFDNGSGLKTFRNPLMFDKRKRKFKTIGEVVEEQKGTPVQGSNGKVYYVHNGKCTCTGFKFRGTCKHIK